MLAFHHVGVGTTRFEDAIETYVALGHRLLRRVDDPGIKVRVAFVRLPGSPLIEIVAPLAEDSPLKSLIARRAVPGPYHTCYAVADLAQGIDYVRQRGFMPVAEPMPAVAFDGQPIVFCYDRHIGLVELVERPPSFENIESA